MMEQDRDHRDTSTLVVARMRQSSIRLRMPQKNKLLKPRIAVHGCKHLTAAGLHVHLDKFFTNNNIFNQLPVIGMDHYSTAVMIGL